MSEVGLPGTPELQEQAALIVERAIRDRGEVRSLVTASGMVRSFEDSISPTIWSGYQSEALFQVDLGNWRNADELARHKVMMQTLQTLINQAV